MQSTLTPLEKTLKTDAKTDLVVTCGVTEARFIATQQLLQPGDRLAAPIVADRLFDILQHPAAH